MEELALQPYKLDTALTNYTPLPREILNMNLPSTAMLLYAVLLDRATLSQKNSYVDSTGWVYVIYPIDNLAETLSVSDTVIKRYLKTLEQHGLLRRYREKQNAPNHIFLNIPARSIKTSTEGTKIPVTSAKPPPSPGRNVPTNNKRKQINQDTYYQHRKDESL